MPGLAAAFFPLLLLLSFSILATVFSVAVLDLVGNFMPQGKLISKLTLALLLLSIFPLRRKLGLSWHDLGFTTGGAFARQVGQGLLLAIATLLPVLVMLYALEIQVWDVKRHWNIASLTEKVTVSLLLAMLIGFGEEVLFRGLLLAGLQRRIPMLMATCISSLYFATLHFLKGHSPNSDGQHSIASGMQLLSEAYGNWLNPQIVPALLSLFIIGLFLSTLRLSVPNSIGLCIGCHAGWVWQIKTCKDLFNLNPNADYAFLVSSYDGVIGPLVSVWLIAALAFWHLIATHRASTKHA